MAGATKQLVVESTSLVEYTRLRHEGDSVADGPLVLMVAPHHDNHNALAA
jgi:hypothetical protein